MIDWITLEGAVEYGQAMSLMEDKVARVINKTSNETIYLLEHLDVYTAGSNYKLEELKDNSLPVYYTGRGGKFTYHGKGQRVIYPILDLASGNRKRDLKLYIANLEKWIILTLKEIGLIAFTIPGLVGIWISKSSELAKIAAIGVRVRKWVTYHGIAVNISTELTKFDGIIPCGLVNYQVTSLEKMGISISQKNFDEILKKKFVEIFK